MRKVALVQALDQTGVVQDYLDLRESGWWKYWFNNSMLCFLFEFYSSNNLL